MTKEAEKEIELGEPPILPEGVPVTMPELPLEMVVNTAQQLKALSDPVRMKIVNIIRHQPATAKQIADRLKVSHGAIGHHLQVLEKAGLVQVVARRLTRGIVAKYYTRSARIYLYEMPPELVETGEVSISIMSQAREEFSEALLTYKDETAFYEGLPHARISPERAKIYAQRLEELVNEFLEEPIDPEGEVFSMYVNLFRAPPWQGPIKE